MVEVLEGTRGSMIEKMKDKFSIIFKFVHSIHRHHHHSHHSKGTS